MSDTKRKHVVRVVVTGSEYSGKVLIANLIAYALADAGGRGRARRGQRRAPLRRRQRPRDARAPAAPHAHALPRGDHHDAEGTPEDPLHQEAPGQTVTPAPVPHLYITEVPIKNGGMTNSDKYVSFTMLCRVDAFAEGQPSEFRRKRNQLSVREHWHGGGKPTCLVCELRQVILRANVRRVVDRGSYTVKEFQVLLRSMEAESASLP